MVWLKSILGLMIDDYMEHKHISLNSFFKECKKESPFSLYGIDTLPWHPAHFWGTKDYSSRDLYLELCQDGGNKGPYSIYIDLFLLIPDSFGTSFSSITMAELKEFYRDDIQCITKSDDNGYEVCLFCKEE